MSVLRILLLPFSLLYGIVVVLRNRFFDIGLLPTTKIPVPVISVGNISAGGVGKTPLVEYLARRLRDKGKKVAVISRGYKRNTKGYVVVSNGRQRCAEAPESGDEPSQLAEKLDGVVVVVDENRVRAAQKVVTDFGVQVILLDDGFQHRYLNRDLNICVVAADEIVSTTWLLPAGNRREFYSALRRADVLVVSRCENERTFPQVQERLKRIVNKPFVGMKMHSVGLKKAGTGETLGLNEAVGKKIVAFSGIGHPSSFEESLRSLSVEVARHHQFPDHHRFTIKNIESITNSFQHERADFIITTEKDVARLKGDKILSGHFFQYYPVYYLEIEPLIVRGEDVVHNLLAKIS